MVRNAVGIVGLGILIVGILYVVFTTSLPTTEPPVSNPDESTVPQRATIEGTWECLPHTDTDGPQTLECAIGIVDGNGLHFAVDTSLMAMAPVDFPTGTKVRAEGVLVPIENLSTDHWQTYNIEGIISATMIQEI